MEGTCECGVKATVIDVQDILFWPLLVFALLGVSHYCSLQGEKCTFTRL